MPSTFKTFERLEPVVEITNSSFLRSKVILSISGTPLTVVLRILFRKVIAA